MKFIVTPEGRLCRHTFVRAVDAGDRADPDVDTTDTTPSVRVPVLQTLTYCDRVVGATTEAGHAVVAVTVYPCRSMVHRAGL